MKHLPANPFALENYSAPQKSWLSGTATCIDSASGFTFHPVPVTEEQLLLASRFLWAGDRFEAPAPSVLSVQEQAGCFDDETPECRSQEQRR